MNIFIFDDGIVIILKLSELFKMMSSVTVNIIYISVKMIIQMIKFVQLGTI